MLLNLFDTIGADVLAADVRAALDEEDTGGEITVRINSPGGSVFDGIAIYSMLAERRDRVRVEVYGIAASIASVIALGGRELIMHEGSFYMIHDPWSMTIGTAADHRKSAEILDQVRDEIANIYRSNTAMTDEELTRAMAEETWMSAAEAVDLGFATRVLETRRRAA